MARCLLNVFKGQSLDCGRVLCKIKVPKPYNSINTGAS